MWLRKNIFNALIPATLFLSLPALAQEMPTGSMQNVMPDVPRGRLEGVVVRLEKSKKTPLGNQTIAIMVFQNGERILMLNKASDAAGHFEFKNIFRDPAFTYAVGTIFEEQVYVIPKISLKPDEEFKKIELIAGEGSPHLMGEMTLPSGGDMLMPPQAGRGKAPFSIHSLYGASYQKAAIFLSLGVMGLALYFGRRKTS